MRMLVCAVPGYGHVLPLVPLAQAAKDLGHEVLLATGDPLLGKLAVPSVRGYPVGTLSEAEEQVIRRHPELAGLAPEEGFRFGLELFADVAFDAMRGCVGGLIESLRPDLVVYEAMAVGAAVAALDHHVPSACVGIGQWSWFPELVHRTVAERHALNPSYAVLADAYIEPFPSTTWSHDRSGLPLTHTMRPVASSLPGSAVPDWLLNPRERPRVYLTLGTVAFGATHALEAALDVLDESDVDVLVAVGPEGDPKILGPRSPRIHVERFVDQAGVLPLVDAVVHHGGTGTMLAAFAAGLPQVLMPQGADQFINAELLPMSGVGRAYLPGMPPAELAAAIQAALHAPSLVAAARNMAKEIATMPAPEHVAKALAALAGQ